MEGILLADLREQIPIDETQYGGLTGSSVDHLLVDLMDSILAPLEEGGAAVVLGVDFEKAFNRLDHNECLKQLKELGAADATISLVRSFLTRRSMRVRIGNHLSNPKSLKGGSPQGSILGCLLYCLATQQIKARRAAGGNEQVPRQHHPDSPEARTSLTPTPSPPGMALLGQLEASPDSTNDGSLEGPDDSQDVVLTTGSGITTFKYIDDTTTVEAVEPGRGIRHITTATPEEVVPAPHTEASLNGIAEKAAEIGMVVNCAKTQLLCVSVDNGYHTTATNEERSSGSVINSVQNMKLLGFMLSDSPDVSAHVHHLRRKFRAKFWGLILLRKAGIKARKLYRLYGSLVRPILECNAIITQPMMTKTQRETLEKMHRQVIRLCFGFAKHSAEHMQEQGLRTLEERRIMAARKFTAKIVRNNERFRRKWLIPRPDDAHGLRNRRPFEERKSRTNRYFNSPLLYIQRLANDIVTE